MPVYIIYIYTHIHIRVTEYSHNLNLIIPCKCTIEIAEEVPGPTKLRGISSGTGITIKYYPLFSGGANLRESRENIIHFLQVVSEMIWHGRRAAI